MVAGKGSKWTLWPWSQGQGGADDGSLPAVFCSAELKQNISFCLIIDDIFSSHFFFCHFDQQMGQLNGKMAALSELIDCWRRCLFCAEESLCSQTSRPKKKKKPKNEQPATLKLLRATRRTELSGDFLNATAASRHSATLGRRWSTSLISGQV